MKLTIHTDEHYMKEALKLANEAREEGEIPVGAVVVSENRIIGKGYNQTERLRDVTAHAEILAITAAQNYLGAKFLKQCTMFVTLEPCVMCAGALYWTQLERLVFGATDEERGFQRIKQSIVHPKTKIETGLMAGECGQLVSDFFKSLRK
ncbi:MAG: nucleoside deaminase [Cyclobacteriaceae bacterium]